MPKKLSVKSIAPALALWLFGFAAVASAFGGEIIRVNVAASDENTLANPQATNELTITVFEPGEESGEQAFLREQVAAAASAKNEATGVFCVAAEKVGAKACDAVRTALRPLAPEKASLEVATVAEQGPVKNTKIRAPGNYRTTYAIIRCILNGSAVATTMIISKGANPLQASLEAALAAGWSAGMQYWNAEYLAWLNSNGWFSADPREPAGATKSFVKKAASSAVYASMLHAGLVVTGLTDATLSFDVTQKLGTAVAASMFTQYYWQRLNQLWTQRAIESDREKTDYYRKNSARGSLLQSVVSVVSSALTVSGRQAGSWVSGIAGTTGLVTYHAESAFPQFAAWIGRWRRRRPKDECEGAMIEVAR